MTEKKTPKPVWHVKRPNRVRIEALRGRGEEGDLIPCIKLRGMWLRTMGFQVGDDLVLEVEPGALRLVRKEEPNVVRKKIVSH